MIFDYNPITGLNYYTCENEILKIELSGIDVSFDSETGKSLIEEWRRHIREMGVTLIDSSKPDIEEVFMPIISNVPYEVFKKRVG